MELAAFSPGANPKRSCAANVRARVIGKRDRLPDSVREALAELEERTLAASGMILNLAIDYSARTELCDAVRALARDVAAGTIEPDAIDDDAIGAKLMTAGMPDPTC
jgi:undecaprenyl diphosphate synthase